MRNIKKFLKNKNVMVIGGTGSWGYELVSQLLDKFEPNKIIIYSRGEHKQVEMKRKFNSNKLKFIIGDVRDKNVLSFAMRNINYVFHLAALKHITVCEDNGWEAVLTNIYGVQNVIETSIEQGVEKVIDVSTDKAVEPFNLYGATKAVGEKLMLNANRLSELKTKFICIRGGNVIGTNGSVIPLFKEQILTKNEITLTNENMTRYIMRTKEAIGLIFKAVDEAIGGEIFVMRMPSAQMRTLAKVMIKLFGNKNTRIKKIGNRLGEKVDEVLISKNEIERTKIINNDYFVILPESNNSKIYEKYKGFNQISIPDFTSKNTKVLTEKELEELFKKELWLWQN